LSGQVLNPNLPGVVCDTTDLTFTTAQVTKVTAVVTDSVAVSFVPAGPVVYVMTNGGLNNAVRFKIVGNDDIEQDTLPACDYHRVG
jgi:hypothetical protein